MLTAHELIGFMSPGLSQEILEKTYASDREVYRAILNAVAEARRVRPVFLERKARPERHKDMVESLSRPRLDAIAANLLRNWLTKHQSELLADFLNALGLPHEKGVIEGEIPTDMEEGKLKAAVDTLLAKHPPEHVAVYLHAFYEMNEARWPSLKNLLENDSRLQLGG